jgi:HSP20 family protein
MNTTLNRWNPLRELEDFQQRVLSAFRPGTNGHSNGNGRDSMTVAEWMPLVDISEDEKEYVISAEIPDVNKDDVKVMMENGLLTIRGERRFERDGQQQKKYHRVERFYGTFSRTFAMPDDGDPSSVHAQFKDGMLCVHIAKSESARPKQIEVKVG